MLVCFQNNKIEFFALESDEKNDIHQLRSFICRPDIKKYEGLRTLNSSNSSHMWPLLNKKYDKFLSKLSEMSKMINQNMNF